MTATSPRRPSTSQRLQDGVLVCIVLAVGAMAGAASFSHVHDWTMDNSPSGTGHWFGWANAVITELIPTAALIVIGRRRRHGGDISYPMFLLIVAVGLSLTAQLAVAEPTVFGWMVSALPALAFFALSKLVFSTTRPTNPVMAPAPATTATAQSEQDTAPATVRPAAVPDTGHAVDPDEHHSEHTDTSEDRHITATAQNPPAPNPATPATPPVAVTPSAEGLAALLPAARVVATSHRQTHGQDISANQLAVRLRVPTAIAADLLTTLDTQPAINSQPHNNYHSAAGVTA